MVKREWVVGLMVTRGCHKEQRMYNVGGGDHQEAIKNALAFEPHAEVVFFREAM